MFEDCKVELLETFGNDLTVVNAARVSLGKHATEFTDKDAKLIKYLADHEHTSPFFHPQLRFRLKMPIWMAREWFRHTIGFSRNEVSRRYVDDPPTFHVPHLRTRAPGKKQGSNDDVHPEDERFMQYLKMHCCHSMDEYKYLLANNIPPEQARMALLYAPYVPSLWEDFILRNRRILADQMEFLMSHVPRSSRLLI